MRKNQANSKQHHEAEPLLFENYSLPSSMLSSKNNKTYSKKISKRTNVFVFMRLYDQSELTWRWKWKIDHEELHK